MVVAASGMESGIPFPLRRGLQIPRLPSWRQRSGERTIREQHLVSANQGGWEKVLCGRGAGVPGEQGALLTPRRLMRAEGPALCEAHTVLLNPESQYVPLPAFFRALS